MASASLHDLDIVAWADEQARELRALSARPDLSNLLDWANLAGEIEDLGKSQVAAVRSKLRLILLHLVKLLSDPEAVSRAHWRAEIIAFQDTVAFEFTNAMRAQIDLDRVWASALREADEALIPFGRRVSRVLPSHCPLSLDELVTEDFETDAILIRLAAARA